jgi:hypothetical protein
MFNNSSHNYALAKNHDQITKQFSIAIVTTLNKCRLFLYLLVLKCQKVLVINRLIQALTFVIPPFNNIFYRYANLHLLG